MKNINEPILEGSLTTTKALQLFDSLDSVSADFMIGRWEGAVISTGHPFDGLLKLAGWYGKMFIDTETVHPLLFWTSGKNGLYAVNPAFIPLRIKLPKTKFIKTLLTFARPVLQTRKSKARIRMTEYRGKVSAAMVYDDKAIFDCFRKITENKVMGAMDLKGSSEPFFFVLERDDQRDLKLHFNL